MKIGFNLWWLVCAISSLRGVISGRKDEMAQTSHHINRPSGYLKSVDDRQTNDGGLRIL